MQLFVEQTTGYKRGPRPPSAGLCAQHVLNSTAGAITILELKNNEHNGRFYRCGPMGNALGQAIDL
jgi:hypothetical protein